MLLRNRCSCWPVAPQRRPPWYAIGSCRILFERDVPAGHRRRLLHELRIRVGVLQARAQGLLQHHHHRAVVAVALIVGTIELISILIDKLGIDSGPLALIGNLNLNGVGFFIVGLFVLTWIVALGIWRFGRIEEKWSANLATSPPSAD